MGLDEAAHLLCIAELMFTGSINHHHTHSMRSPAWQHVIPALYHYSDYAINQFQHHHPVSLLWMNPVKAIQMECGNCYNIIVTFASGSILYLPRHDSSPSLRDCGQLMVLLLHPAKLASSHVNQHGEVVTIRSSDWSVL